MSINIFQFLKQGTSLSRKQLQKNKKLEQQIQTTQRTPNKLYMETGKFTESDHEQEHGHSKKDGGQWQQLNQEKMKHKHNKQIQKSIDLRNKYKIKVEGTDAPFVVSNFNSLATKYYVSQHLIQGLAQMGFKKPTPVQMQAFPALLEDRNVLVTAPTGTGKTLSYLLPLYHNILKKRKEQQHKHQQAQKKRLKSKEKKQKNQIKDKLEAENSLVFNKVEAIILAPQQELSTQIIHQIKSLVSIHEKNESTEVQKVVYKCVSELSQSDMKKINRNKPFGVNIIVATPQIFLNIFGHGKQQLISHCKYIILDECDKYFEESFLQQIRNILEIFSIIKPRPVYGLFSATIQHPVQELLKSQIIDDALRIQIGGKNKVISNVQQTIQYCTNQYGKILQLKNMIAQNKFIPPALIFVQQKIRAKQLYFEMKKIMKNGPGGLDLSKKIQVLSGQKNKEQRKQILQKFEKGSFLVLITTDLIARGIDFSHVNLVINYDFPNSMLTYIHRVGRTGRAERTGYAVTFFTEEDKPIVKSLANLLAASGCKVPQWILQLPNVNKNLKKRLQKYPTKRLPVGVSQGRDKNFDKQLQRMEKIWKIKKQREIQRQKNVDGQQEEWIQV